MEDSEHPKVPPLLKDAAQRVEIDDFRRDRLLAALTLIIGAAFCLGLPFALQAGAEFFLPLTAAIVVSIALVPLLEWLERRRVPSALAAFLALSSFLMLVNAALAIIVVPATGWFARIPESIPRIQTNLAPVIDFYSTLQKFVDRTLTSVASGSEATAQAMAATAPTSVVDYFISAAPAAAVQLLFAVLVIFFFLAGWTRLRRSTIRRRGSFDGAMQTARVIQNVVDATADYLATITMINALLGLIVSLLLWALGMPSPFMWGGIVSLCNFVPYLGPIVAAMLLGLGGLMTFDAVGVALLPAVIFIGVHLVEANLITPLVLGRRLTVNPLLILVSLSFWGWVWGTPGALLAVPLLLIVQTVLASTGTPDLAGFLFEHGTLTATEEMRERLNRKEFDRDG
ncbi:MULTISPECIES: AI-2E family transporter [Sphingopyxis]|jgi:predicted PurR-regulated permease PerM|uniref:Predicted PurR-regulated permease PerM n=2 Tax=Sphingopyxis terrae TaxID=33052 RepID=A0A1Y6E6A3_9SPHN|nr:MULTISPECIES: AI-2E family transporter [Sphingopyxis]MBD3745877.1 AI-2E family transporter [Sphingopyxis terrae]AMU95951.1 permease [Sphingopyxis terrae subsp. terrae NBRC 15098]KTE77825.1 permease [Sphingopyxis sp. A083]MBU7590600.1 AI-2E family transporter [Sphingopyxis terrae]PCF92783.1 AI-2E family transporter [Sphingopyxis terrae subsp. ummariensis]